MDWFAIRINISTDWPELHEARRGRPIRNGNGPKRFAPSHA
jgi:hypothetical protein